MEIKMEHNYKISFKIGESEFEIESTDLKWLEGKEKEYLRKLQSKPPIDYKKDEKTELTAKSRVVPPKMTLNEFYRKYVHNIKSRPTIAVYMVYYLQKIRKKDKIRTGDVANCFKEIAYPNWNKLNMTDILSSCKRRALVNYVNKHWSLTTTGEDFVLNAITGKTK
jgi:hypothetical protein